MNGIIDWLNSIPGPDNAICLLLTKFVPWLGPIVAILLILKTASSWIKFLDKSRQRTRDAYVKVGEIAGRATAARVAVTAVFVVGLILWLVAVQVVTNLSRYLVGLMGSSTDTYADIPLTTFLSEVDWYGFGGFTKYALLLAVVGLICKFVNKPGAEFLAAGAFFAVSLISIFVFVLIAVPTFFQAVLSLLAHGASLFDQNDGLEWHLIVSVAYAFYLASFVMVYGAFMQIRQLWGVKSSLA